MILNLAVACSTALLPASGPADTPSPHPLQADSPAWLKNLQVRSTTSDLNAIEKPASIQWTDPSGPSNSTYSVDAGIRYLYEPSEAWKLYPSIEFHKQTLTTKRQDTRLAGLTAAWIPLDINPRADGWTPVIGLDGKFKDDRVADAEGALLKASATAVAPELLMGMAGGPPCLEFLWQPGVAAVFQSSNDANGAGDSGTVERLAGSMEVGLYPFGEELRKNLELRSSITYWRDLSQHGGFDGSKEDRRVFKAGMTYYFDADQHFGVSLDYVNGEDPELSLPDQEYLQLALKVKF